MNCELKIKVALKEDKIGNKLMFYNEH